MKYKSISKIILGAALFALALCGFTACEKSAAGFGQAGTPPIELERITPKEDAKWALIIDAKFIFAMILGVAVVALTTFMAVRIIREKRADKRAARAVAEDKWKKFEEKEEK